MLGIGIVFPATHPFFLHTINISNDQTLILDISYYWKKKKKNSRRPILKMHQHALLMQGMALAVPDSGCDSSCFTSTTPHQSLRGHWNKNATYRHLKWYSSYRLLRQIAVPPFAVSAISNPCFEPLLTRPAIALMMCLVQ